MKLLNTFTVVLAIALTTIEYYSFAEATREARLANAPKQPGCMTSRCHADLGHGASVHGPVKAKGCMICHDGGEVKNENLPSNHPRVGTVKHFSASTTCILCHDAMKSLLKNTNGHAHKPLATEGCLACHDPHRSKNLRLLKTESGQSGCLSCHKEMNTALNSATHKHAAIFEKSSCVGCHDPHGTNNPKLLRNSVTATCLRCHDKSLKAADGRQLPDFKGWAESSRAHHGSTAALPPDCTSCHVVHGNSEQALLKDHYEPKFHAPFDIENFSLCFKCHKAELATEATTTTATSFRNGSRNLHFAHLNGKRRARTCGACHNPHQTDGPKLIGRWIPYGKLLLPLEFSKTPSGGNCTTACHGNKSYDRLKEERGAQ